MSAYGEGNDNEKLPRHTSDILSRLFSIGASCAMLRSLGDATGIGYVSSVSRPTSSCAVRLVSDLIKHLHFGREGEVLELAIH
jgi:hypothetical protein